MKRKNRAEKPKYLPNFCHFLGDPPSQRLSSSLKVKHEPPELAPATRRN
jgi:hypothetical protein